MASMGGGDGLSGDVDRHAELPLINPHAAGVVAVIMRNHQGIDVADVETVGGESLFRLPPADPGVKQQTNTVRFHEDAVAVAAGLESDHSQSGIVTR